VNDHMFPLPWRCDAGLGAIFASDGRLVARCVAFDQEIGVLPQIETHARAIVDAVNGAHAIYVADSLSALQGEVKEWADATFPHRMPAIAWMKLFEELGEVIRAPLDKSEWADVFILLLDLATIYGVDDLHAVIRAKIEVNKSRTWRPTHTGTLQSVIPEA